GFGYEAKDIKSGNLALFYPAYPQPGINITLLTEDDQEETNSNQFWKYQAGSIQDC
ncbi:hypothetical protein BDR05DRAFT_880914, partial [Suillus weaverae]